MLFDDLTETELREVEKIGVLKKYGDGDAIIQEGTTGTSFSLIIAGQAEVRKEIKGGRYKTLVKLGPCDLIGEIGFFGINARTASVVAVSDCEVLEFEGARFEKFLFSHSAIGMKVYRGMARELAQRMVKSGEHLLDTIVWALGQSKSPAQSSAVEIPEQTKLSIKQE